MKIDLYQIGLQESLVDETKFGVKITLGNGMSALKTRAVTGDAEVNADKVYAEIISDLFKELDLL